MKRVFTLILVAVFTMPHTLEAQDPAIFDKDTFIASANENKTLELGMADCIELAFKNNSEIKIKRISPLIEDANVEIEKARFEPDLSFDFTMEEETKLSPTGLISRSPSKEKTREFNFGYDQTLVTGTKLDIDFYNTRYWSNSPIRNINPSFESNIDFAITQPLLKGFGVLVNKKDFLIAKNNRKKSESEFKEEVIAVLTDVKKSYYDFQYWQEQHKTVLVSLRRVEGLHQINKERHSKGLASDVDLLESESDLARAEQEVASTEAAMKLAEDNLKLVTNLVDDPEIWNSRILLSDRPGYEKRELDLVEMIKTAFQYRPDYEASKIDLKNKDIQLAFDKNGLLPTVDLQASYGLNGLAKNYGEDLSHIGGGKYDNWLVGLSVKMPLGGGEEKGRYEKAKLEKAQALINFKRLEQRIILEVRDAVRDVEINYRMLEASLKSKFAEEKQYASQEERFKAGLVSTHDIIDYEEHLAKAEADYIKSVIDYNKSLIDLAKACGRTLADEHIRIE